jgi:DNA-binding SARP family transcriptional activator
MLEVFLLGQFDVIRDGKHLTIPTRNAQSLFAYLILNAGTAYRRELLAGMLWPDSTEETARSNLRHELWRLRKAIDTNGQSYILGDDMTLSFNPQADYVLDVRILEGIPLESSTDQLIRALEAYCAELLPGFYHDWVLLARQRMVAIFDAKLSRLLELLLAEQRWQEVLDWAQRWISFGQQPEAAYRAMMLAYANLGDLWKAVTTYENFSKAMQSEMGIQPSKQTREIYQRIKEGW